MGSKQSGTQTTTVEPPSIVKPYLQQGYQTASSLLSQGGPQQYQGNTVAPFAPQQEQAMQLASARALGGSPVMSAAQNQAAQTLGGDFLNSNPYLDETFRKAAQATRSALDTQFAGSGRDLIAQLPGRSDQLNNLANQIYGGNYQAERARQMQAIPFASGLANQDWTDIGQLANVGSQIQGQTQNIINDRVRRWDFEQMRPEDALSSYLARIQGLAPASGQTSSQPIYSNPAGSALGGALGGGALFGPWGALGGGLLGLLGGI